MKASKISIIILLIAALITGSVEAQAASVSLNMTSFELYAGQTLDVNVTVDPEGVGIAGVQIDVFFDGNTLEPVAVKEGNLLDQNGANTFFYDLAPGSNSISNIVGAILENSSVINPNIFATITFKAKNAGTSFIELKNVKISKSSGDLFNVSVSNRTSLNIISNTNNDGNSGSSGASSGGGGGGAGGTSGEDFNNIELKEKFDRFINKDIPASYCFRNTNNPINCINITAKISPGEINTAVEVLRNTSSLVKSPAPDTLYKNLNIWVGTYGFATPTNINHAEITFRVPVSWMISNSIDPDSITMMHYQGAWESLPTKKISKTSEWIYYEASTTRFSPHAITGKTSSGGSYNWIPQTAANTESTENTGSQQMEEQVTTVGNEAKSPGIPSYYLIIGAILGLAFNGALIYKIRKPKKRGFFN
jgi:PGF-pre-PGF domain-containing protein